MDKLDERLARFLGRAATAQVHPRRREAVRHLGAAADPLLYPAGTHWDFAWSQHEALERAAAGDASPGGRRCPFTGRKSAAGGGCRGGLHRRWPLWPVSRARHRPLSARFESQQYRILRGDRRPREMFSRVLRSGYDLSRRCYDSRSGRQGAVPGRCLRQPAEAGRAWPVRATCRPLGTLAGRSNGPRRLLADPARRTTASAPTSRSRCPGPTIPVELWTITLENLTDADREVKVVPYLEWVLNRPDADRRHTQYNRLFAEMEYLSGLHAVLAWDKHSRADGLLAAEATPKDS